MHLRPLSFLVSRIGLMAAVTASGWLVSDSARAADDKQVCLGAYISAQRLRQEDKLLEARDQLLTCARDVCPPTLKKDCITWTGEVDHATPSVVIDARNEDGGDIIDVKVTVDGKLFVSHLDGKARPLNPGVHTFHYETEGATAIDEKVVIRAGEKMRKIVVKFAKKGTGAAPAPTSTAANDEPDDEGDKERDASDKGAGRGVGGSDTVAAERPVPAGVYVLGGLGLAALGGFTYFALKFDGQVKDLDQCKPQCPPSQVDDASSTRTISYIPLGIGVASIGAAAIWYLARPTLRPATTALGPRLDMKQLPGGGMATFSTSF